MKHILIINGPNLNLLGRREPLLYGERSFSDYAEELRAAFPEIRLTAKLCNEEGEMVTALHEAFDAADGVVINPAAFSHTSLAVADAVAALRGENMPVVEVHITNVYAREAVRSKSFVSKYASGVISGLGLEGYRLAVSFLAKTE